MNECTLFVTNGYDDDDTKFFRGTALNDFLNNHPKVATWWLDAKAGDIMRAKNYFGELTYLIKVNNV